MCYELEFIMGVSGHPCKSEEFNTLNDCFNRIKELNNLAIKWYDFRIHEIARRHNMFHWKNEYLCELYNRRLKKNKMWVLTIFWNDATKTTEKYTDYRQAVLSVEYYIRLAMPKIQHFKLQYRGEDNE